MHVKGLGGGDDGTLTVTTDISKYPCARLFDKVGKQTGLIMRFSTVASQLGSADA